MNISKQLAQDVLKHLFQNEAITGIGDASGVLGSATAGSLYLRGCTDAVAANIETLGTECAYTGYTAGGVAIARTTGKWTVSWNDTDNKAELVNVEEELMGERTDAGAAETLKYIELWKNNSSSAIADRLAWAELTTPLSVTQGVQPRFAAGKIKFKLF